MTDKLQLLLLGPAQLHHHGHPIELKSAKAMALLAYLAAAPRYRDHLTDLFWPDSLPDAARKNLRNTLWAIRKTLDGGDILDTNGDRMELTPALRVDVRDFEAVARQAIAAKPVTEAELQAALELYRGPLLDGLSVADAPDFELWLSTERERFGQLFLRLVEALVAHRQAEHNWPGVILAARRALAADNLQEPMYRVLMTAHAHLGERAEALRLYDTLRNMLLQELGVPPLPETEALRQAILAGTIEPPPTPPAAASLPSAPRIPRPKTMLPFVGRQGERAALDEELRRARQGQARVVLLAGELGIGKTRLWQEWAGRLPDGFTVLETRCLDTTQSLPFAPLTGLFGQAMCVDALTRSNSPISPIWLTELARLVPELRQRLPHLPAPPHLPTEEEHRRLYEAFTQILRAMNHRPQVLFIDDLHWIDHSTLDWLVYLIDRMAQEPLLLVGTYRPSDASRQLSQITAGWARQGVLRRLSLARFSMAETSALLTALGSPAQRAEELQRRSAGNPYFLLELNRAEPGDTPPALAELLHTRLERLPDTARQVLQAAAVLETDFEFTVLRRTSGRGEEETLNALDALLENNVLRENASGYQFAHPLVAGVVRSNLSLARRSFLHRRAALALEAAYANRLETIAAQLAHHFAQAGRPAKAAQYAEMAGDRAQHLTALSEAITFFQQALTLEPTPNRRMKLGTALIFHGDLDLGRSELWRSAEASREAGDTRSMVQAYLALALSHMTSGQGELVLRWAKAARDSLGDEFFPEALAQSHFLLAAGGMLVGRSLAEAEAHLNEGIRLATANDLPDLAGSSRFELGNLLAQRGHLPEALRSFRAALNFAQATDNLLQQVLAHNNLAYHSTLTGDLLTARRHIDLALDLAENHALFSPRQYLYSTRGEVALAQGEFDEAESWFNRALVSAQQNHNNGQAANIRANLGLVAQARGNLDEALLLLEEARQSVQDLNSPHLQIQLDLWLAELYLKRDERATAVEALNRAKAHLADSEREGLLEWSRRVEEMLQGE
jgi:DNA-binding SARP family transcriptional activator/predicted ATPase